MSNEKAAKLKDEGNVLFKKGKYNDALGKYSQGMSTNSILWANNSGIILSFAI